MRWYKAGAEHMSRRQTMRGAIFRVAAAVLVLCHASAAAVEEVKFADLDPKAAGQVVLFYRKGAEASDAAVAALAEAELLVKASAGAKAADVVFKQCNAAQKENMVGMEAKGLTSLPMIFVGVEGQGTGKTPPTADNYVRPASRIHENFRHLLHQRTLSLSHRHHTHIHALVLSLSRTHTHTKTHTSREYINTLSPLHASFFREHYAAYEIAEYSGKTDFMRDTSLARA